jgi:hypothetical protein
MRRMARVCSRLVTRLLSGSPGDRLRVSTAWLVREMRRTARGNSSHTAREKGRYRAVHLAFSKGNGEAMLEQEEFIYAETRIIHCKKGYHFSSPQPGCH